jgi:hypothetical protein
MVFGILFSCVSDEDSPEEALTVLNTGLHEFAFSFLLPQMYVTDGHTQTYNSHNIKSETQIWNHI